MSHVLGGLTIDLYQLITHLEATILSGWTYIERNNLGNIIQKEFLFFYHQLPS